MRVSPQSHKPLIAIKNGRLVKIASDVMRKPYPLFQQMNKLQKRSICIVCTYLFAEQDVEWSRKVKAVCHPFRNEKVLGENVRKFLFSESDFCDSLISPVTSKDKKKKYDFCCFMILSPKGVKCKGLYLLPLIDSVCSELGLKGLCVFYSKENTAKIHKNSCFYKAYQLVKKKIRKLKNIEIISKFYSQSKVSNIMGSSSLFLCPSIADASPRLITEALIRNCPILINKDIYGGWKYVNDKTGRFFSAPDVASFVKQNGSFTKEQGISLKISFQQVLEEIDRGQVSYQFYKDYGFDNSSKKLARIMNKVWGTNYTAVAFQEWKKQLTKIGKKNGWI